MNAWLALCFALTLSCSSAPSIEIQATKSDNHAKPKGELDVDGVHLFLDHCRITATIDKKRFEKKLSLPSGCFFAPDKRGKPHVVDTPYGKMLIVMSVSAPDGNNDCIAFIQGVLVSEFKMKLSKRIPRFSMCDKGPLDEKNYQTLAYEITNEGD